MRTITTIAVWILATSLSFAQLDLAPSHPAMVAIEQAAPIVWHEVQAVSSPVEDAARHVVQVRFPNGNAFESGSGVYLGERLVATAYHVPRGTSGRGYATFRDGFATECTAIQSDKVWDQCILELDKEHPSLLGVELAEKNPRAGEMVYSSGFGAGFRIFGGRVTGNWARPKGATTTDWFHHENPAISGDSGGPVFNAQGKLIGCLWGSSGGETVATGTGRFNVFVKSLFPRLAEWRADRIARQIAGVAPNQGCFGGQCPPPSQGGGRDVQIFPGGGQPTPAPVPPQPLPLPPPQQPDLSQLLPSILDGLAKDDRFRGPAGKDGKDGRDGVDGKDGRSITDEEIGAIVSAIRDQLKNDPQPALPGPAGPAGPPGKDGQSVAREDIEKIVEDSVKRALGKLAVVPPANSDAANRVLYFTSTTCQDCSAADEKINALKSRGAPITVIRLSEKDAQTQGVPMIFIPATERRIAGLANVLFFLSSVTY